MKKSDMERIGLAPHPFPLSPNGARGKNILQLTPSAPSGERVPEGRVRGGSEFLHTLYRADHRNNFVEGT